MEYSRQCVTSCAIWPFIGNLTLFPYRLPIFSIIHSIGHTLERWRGVNCLILLSLSIQHFSYQAKTNQNPKWGSVLELTDNEPLILYLSELWKTFKIWYEHLILYIFIFYIYESNTLTVLFSFKHSSCCRCWMQSAEFWLFGFGNSPRKLIYIWRIRPMERAGTCQDI